MSKGAIKARKKNPALGVLLILFGCFVLFSGISGLTDNKHRLIAPGGRISVEIVDDDESRATGLSGRESIDTGAGMLFVFDSESTASCLWMKDMNFPIDMIWMDEDKNVITMSQDVAPETYPKTFCPESPAKYALEIGAGQAAELNIAKGEKLRF